MLSPAPPRRGHRPHDPSVQRGPRARTAVAVAFVKALQYGFAHRLRQAWIFVALFYRGVFFTGFRGIRGNMEFNDEILLPLLGNLEDECCARSRIQDTELADAGRDVLHGFGQPLFGRRRLGELFNGM